MRVGRIFAGLMLVLLPLSAAADTLANVSETVWLASDGPARVDVLASVPAGFIGPLRVPVQFGSPESVEASLASEQSPQPSNNTGAPLIAIWDPARRQIVVQLQAAPFEDGVIRVSFVVTLPGGDAQQLQGAHRFNVINTSEHAFGHYSLEIVLPEGYVYSTVDGINASSGASPRVTSRDGHHAVVVEAPLREYEGTVSLSVVIERVHRKGLVPLVALLLSAGYLVRFRDLATRRTP